MAPLTWLALAAAFGVAALPNVAVSRAGGLVVGGRLATHRRPAGRRPPRDGPAKAATIGGAALLLGVVLWRGGPALTIAAGAALGIGGLFLRDAVRGRREARHHRELVTAVRVLAGELSAGARPADALAAATLTGDHAAAALGPAAAAQRAGQDAAAVLESAEQDGMRALAVAWRLGATTGAALAEVVDRVAADLAAHDTRRRAVTVAVAGPRSSAVLVAGLPAIGIALGAAMGAGPVAFLLGDPVGRLLCCAGVVLDAAGLLWIRRIVGRVQRR